MYSPYLYARQYELLALRALIKESIDLTKLIPILEPVKTDTSDIRRCMEAFSKKEQNLIVVVNPALNEFSKNPPRQKQFREDINDILAKSPCIIPGLEISAGITEKTLEKFFIKYPSRPVALLLNNPSLDHNELATYTQHVDTQFNITINNKTTTAQNQVIPVKKLIHNNDDFNKKSRNADYGGHELFTDRHNLIADKAAAFGDYTVTGKKFELGGGTPGAVAIHTIYKNSKSSDIWIEHFVSDETDRNEGSPETKFLEAARKLIKAVKSRPAEFGWNSALAEYENHVNLNTWSGLGKNKEYQIRHHISFMLDILNKKL
ncbi:sce7725 family protein [Pseudomonas folii]|uniref:Sce7725 family protein n=1 Tax=Pseudomonas folii TaxID=2762593 RepID=A0ABR7B798_9PSED|nr:sce7725 family protein [Pseudomonas folii]MBC3953044.1 sce7725 family protein [Pseudomonas folii]